MPVPFVHLHNHSEFSLLDGHSKIKGMVAHAVACEMPALAITDHGTMYGCAEFAIAAKAAGIQPIIGCEMYVCQGDMLTKDPLDRAGKHLVVLAKNQTGYRNLMKLATAASIEGSYYKPRVDKKALAEHGEGLIICSACMGGELAQAVMQDATALTDAERVASWYREVWGDDFYLEVQGHHSEGQWEINEGVRRLSERTGIRMVATNDSHYTKAEDAEAHDVLVCIQTGQHVSNTQRMRYEPREFYIKTGDEITQDFLAWGPAGAQAVANTLEVAEKCKGWEIEMGRAPLPTVPLPDGQTAMSHMSTLCREGLVRRLPKASSEHVARLEYELTIIEATGFPEYLLIVREIAQFTRGAGIAFGVRGSAAGSIACFCLGITDLDPLEYDLAFERFLNPERVTMPDIDMDFEDTRRSEVVQFCVDRYGKDKVAYLTTFGTLQARGAIRDCGRVMNYADEEVARLAEMVPKIPVHTTIKQAIERVQELRFEYEKNPRARRLLDTAMSVESVSRNASTHAAGIMISDKPLIEYTPLCTNKAGDLLTQYPHSSLEAIGLLKMDFLGLKNLRILATAVRLIKESRGELVDVWNIPLKPGDERADRAYTMLGTGDTSGVFQLESAGMRKHIKQLKPTSVAELQAMVALYRPGPMAHIPRYIRGKFDPQSIRYALPSLEPILRSTYGVIVYQDQVLKIVQAVAGFSLGKADLLRRAMGKKKREEMDKQKADFLAGAESRGVDMGIAASLFADIEPFAGYAFNGAHAACYGMLAYQTAFLKANYPAEYMAAVMEAFIGKQDKVASASSECAALGVNVLPPDVNASRETFFPEQDDTGAWAIRWGLLSISGIGEGPVKAIVGERTRNGPYTSLDDLVVRGFTAGANSKTTYENIIRSGSFRSVDPGRQELIDRIDPLLVAGRKEAKKRGLLMPDVEPVSLFGEGQPSLPA